MSGRRVVLTGRGVASPLGVGIRAHWDALVAGCSAVAPIARLRALGLPASRGAEIVPDLLAPHLARLPRKQQKLYSRTSLLAALAASLAMEEARLPPGADDPARFGVVLGVNAAVWSLEPMTQYLVAAESRSSPGTLDMALANAYCMRNVNPLDYSLKTLPNLAAGHLAIEHDAQGLCRAVTEGPLGGAQAVGQAYRLIAEGELEVALCGGADAQLEELAFAAVAGAGLLASDDGGSPGEIDGEGSGILVLEAAERAEARGGSVLGEVLGFTVAAGDGVLTPESDSSRLAHRLARVIRATLDESRGEPDLVCLHGDGAPVHDRAEALALEAVLGPRARRTPIVQMKRAHGHLGAASAPVEILACSALLERRIIPPIISTGSHTLPAEPSRVLVTALGRFGECAALMLGRPGALSAD